MHGKVVHFIPYMFVFSCQICRTGFVEFQKFYFHGTDVSSLLCKELYHGHLASWVRRDRASKRGNRLGESRKQQQQKKKNKLNCCSEQLYGVLDCRCLACVQTSPASSGKNRERRRFFLDGGGDVCTQTNRCLSWQWGMKGTTQASGADSTSAGTCWHNVYKQDSSTW